MAKTRFVIRTKDGKKVFSCKNKRLRELKAVDLSPITPRRIDVEIVRNGKIFDTGEIELYGTHGEAPYFMRFWKIAKKVQRWIPESVVRGNLQADWFEIGDQIVVDYPERNFLQNIR